MARWTAKKKAVDQADPSAAPVLGGLAMIPFDKLPLSDTCWSILTGPDNRIYAAACTEHVGGVSAYLVRYTPAAKVGQGRMEYLFDVGDAVGEPADNGRATQCKIHYCLMPDPQTGVLYGATHLSAPPRGDAGYSWFGSWHEPERSFRGSFLFAFDTRTDKLLWTDMCYPWEGSRCMALDRKRGLIHGVAFPRSHYFTYDLETHKTKDCGRTGSVNPQAVWLDSEDNAYTTDDWGTILRFNAGRGRPERLEARLPCAAGRDSWHNVSYDVVRDPTDPDVVYGCPWNIPAHIFRYRMDPKGGPGEMSDCGAALPGGEPDESSTFFTHHVGGLAFGNDGALYYAAGDNCNEYWLSTAEHKCWLVRMDRRTLAKEKVGLLGIGDFRVGYISRTARTRSGRFVMADVGKTPSRIYEWQSPGASDGKTAVEAPLRLWG